MPKSKEQIIADVKAYIAKDGRAYSNWYVGITKDVEKRLFADHGVRKEGDLWIYVKAFSSEAARDVEDYFVHTCGTDGGGGGGGDDSTFVYAYEKNSHTAP